MYGPRYKSLSTHRIYSGMVGTTLKEEINLKDNLGNRYQPLALEGAAWEEQKPTPASGTDHFIFTFPPLSSGVTTIDFLEGKSGIFDIRLTGDIPSIRLQCTDFFV